MSDMKKLLAIMEGANPLGIPLSKTSSRVTEAWQETDLLSISPDTFIDTVRQHVSQGLDTQLESLGDEPYSGFDLTDLVGDEVYADMVQKLVEVLAKEELQRRNITFTDIDDLDGGTL